MDTRNALPRGRWLLATALAVLTTVGTASPATAAPKPKPTITNAPTVTNCAYYIDENVTEAIYDTVQGRDCLTLLARSVKTIAMLHGVTAPERLAAVPDQINKQIQTAMARTTTVDAATMSVPDAPADAATRSAQLDAARWVIQQMKKQTPAPTAPGANGGVAQPDADNYLNLHWIEPVTVTAAPIRDVNQNIFAYNLTTQIRNSMGRFDFLMQGNAQLGSLHAKTLTYYRYGNVSSTDFWTEKVYIDTTGNVSLWKAFGNSFASQSISLQFNPQGNVLSASAQYDLSKWMNGVGFYTYAKAKAHWTSVGVVQAELVRGFGRASLSVTGGWDVKKNMPMGSLNAAYQRQGMGGVAGSLGWSEESDFTGMVNFFIQLP